MAIFTESKILDRIKDWAKKENKRLGYDEDAARKRIREESKKKSVKDESSQKKKGLLTREDFSNALSLTKSIIGGNSTVGKYLNLYTVDELMKDYSKSKDDYIMIGSLYTMNPDDIDDQDVLVPHEDADWYKGDAIKRGEEIDNLMFDLSEKLEKESIKRYGDSFVVDFDSSWYGFYYYVESKKPKGSSNNKDK